MSFRRKLFAIKKPFDVEASEKLFLKAVKENCKFHYNNCKEYHTILDYFQFNPNSIKTTKDIAKIPFLPTLFFKNHSVFSMSNKRILFQSTSSGTSGKFSKIKFDMGGLACGLNMVIKIGNFRRLFSLMPTHYIVLGYQPYKGNQTAATKTAFGATLFSPAVSRTYALKYKNSSYHTNLTGVIRAVHKYSRSKFPIRLIGFPSYTYFVLKKMEEQGIAVRLPKGSKIMLGGGWKQFYAQQVDKTVLYSLSEKVLGVKEENIIEFFSAVEHPILYCDCKNHHFHIPVYSRVIIRDVNTLKPLKFGETGLVNLITPLLKATPILSVMTDDLGILHSGEECGCGITSPYLEIVGRVGLKDIKTCAAGAAEFLSGVKL